MSRFRQRLKCNTIQESITVFDWRTAACWWGSPPTTRTAHGPLTGPDGARLEHRIPRRARQESAVSTSVICRTLFILLQRAKCHFVACNVSSSDDVMEAGPTCQIWQVSYRSRSLAVYWPLKDGAPGRLPHPGFIISGPGLPTSTASIIQRWRLLTSAWWDFSVCNDWLWLSLCFLGASFIIYLSESYYYCCA